uniref:DUF5741 domain-containing protein n=1 Tax=Heterorhabditis bacteriophora TaxID=37862 RepID=A0A1I7WWD8_HETBA
MELLREKYEIDRQQSARRIAELEDENKDLHKKLAHLSSENCELRDRLLQLDVVQVDLDMAKERVKKEAEENKKLYNQLKLMDDYDYLANQNAKLSEELSKLKTECSRSRAVEIQERDIERKITEESYQLKIKELKMVVAMMVRINNKIKSLSSERNFLRDELRALRKEVLKDASRGRKRDALFKIDSKEIGSRRRRAVSTLNELSDVETSEEASVTSSTFSDGNVEIKKIKERIRNLDEIARDLDATVEHFTSCRSNNQERSLPTLQESFRDTTLESDKNESIKKADFLERMNARNAAVLKRGMKLSEMKYLKSVLFKFYQFKF